MHTPSAYTYTHACVKEVSYISLTVTCNFEQYWCPTFSSMVYEKRRKQSSHVIGIRSVISRATTQTPTCRMHI